MGSKKHPLQNRTNVQIKGGGVKGLLNNVKKTALFWNDGFPYGVCTYVCSFCICECGRGCIFARGCHLHLLLAPTTHNPSPPWKMFKASSYSFPTYKAYFISLIATASPLEKELTVHTFHCTSLKFSKPFSYVLAAIMILLASGRRCLGHGNFDFLASIVKYFIC